MKTTNIFFALLAIFCLGSIAAQDGPPPPPPHENIERFRQAFPEGRERIEAARQSFIKQELQLTDREAERFFPLLRKYDKAMRELNKKEYREFGLGRKGKEKDKPMSEADALKRINDQLAHETAMLDLRKESVEAFLEVIPASKLVKLKRAEKKFRRKLMERIRQRRRHK